MTLKTPPEGMDQFKSHFDLNGEGGENTELVNALLLDDVIRAEMAERREEFQSILATLRARIERIDEEIGSVVEIIQGLNQLEEDLEDLPRPSDIDWIEFELGQFDVHIDGMERLAADLELRQQMGQQQQRLADRVAEIRRQLDSLTETVAMAPLLSQLNLIDDEVQDLPLPDVVSQLDAMLDDLAAAVDQLAQLDRRRQAAISSLQSSKQKLSQAFSFKPIQDQLELVESILSQLESDDPPDTWDDETALAESIGALVDRAAKTSAAIQDIEQECQRLKGPSDFQPLDATFGQAINASLSVCQAFGKEGCSLEDAEQAVEQLMESLAQLRKAKESIAAFAKFANSQPKGQAQNRWTIADDPGLAEGIVDKLLKDDLKGAQLILNVAMCQKLKEAHPKQADPQQKPKDRATEDLERSKAGWHLEVYGVRSMLDGLIGTPAVLAKRAELDQLEQAIDNADTSADGNTLISQPLKAHVQAIEQLKPWAIELQSIRDRAQQAVEQLATIPDASAAGGKQVKAVAELVKDLSADDIDENAAASKIAEIESHALQAGPIAQAYSQIDVLAKQIEAVQIDTGMDRLNEALKNESREITSKLGHANYATSAQALQAIHAEASNAFLAFQNSLQDAGDFVTYLGEKDANRDNESRRELIEQGWATMKGVRQLFASSVTKLLENGLAEGKKELDKAVKAAKDIVKYDAVNRHVTLKDLGDKGAVLSAIKGKTAGNGALAGGNGKHHTNPQTGGNGSSKEYYAIGTRSNAGHWTFQSNNPHRFIKFGTTYWYTSCHYVNSSAKKGGNARKTAYNLVVGI